MNCGEWEERLALYAGGDLAPAERAAAERHLGECAGCQLFLSGVAQGLAVLKEAHAEGPSAAELAAVRARVLAELGRRRRPRWAWVLGLAAAAAAVWLVFAAVRPTATPVPRVAEVQTQPAPERMEPAPQAVRRVPVRVARRPRPRVAAAPEIEPARPLVVKLVTDDPDVVIYWITEKTGEME